MGMKEIDADFGQILLFAKRYSGLGAAVQDQLDNLMDGEDRMNPNAIKLIHQRLGGAHPDLDDAISDYFESRT
jgi:hypothetical protein